MLGNGISGLPHGHSSSAVTPFLISHPKYRSREETLPGSNSSPNFAS
jgi:hypothetical protein